MQVPPVVQQSVSPRVLRSSLLAHLRLRRRIEVFCAAAALCFAIVAVGAVLVGGGYLLVAPACAIAAVALAQLVLYRYNERQPAALIGNALGMCALLLWLVIDLVVGRLIGFDFSLLQTLIHMAAE